MSILKSINEGFEKRYGKLLDDRKQKEVKECDGECKDKKAEKELTEAPIYGLEAQHDSRKSFGGKAQVETDNAGTETLYSYNTPVVKIVKGKVTLLPKWDSSATTLRHVKEFLKQHDLKAESKEQIAKDYGEKVEEGCKKEVKECADTRFRGKKAINKSSKLEESSRIVYDDSMAGPFTAAWRNFVKYVKGWEYAEGGYSYDRKYLNVKKFKDGMAARLKSAGYEIGDKDVSGSFIGNNNAYQVFWIDDEEKQICCIVHINIGVYGEIYTYLTDIDDKRISETYEVRYGGASLVKEGIDEMHKKVKSHLKEYKDMGQDLGEYQKWVDYDMKRYHKISDKTMDKIKEAGLTVVKDQYGDYEVIAHEPVRECDDKEAKRRAIVKEAVEKMREKRLSESKKQK